MANKIAKNHCRGLLGCLGLVLTLVAASGTTACSDSAGIGEPASASPSNKLLVIPTATTEPIQIFVSKKCLDLDNPQDIIQLYRVNGMLDSLEYQHGEAGWVCILIGTYGSSTALNNIWVLSLPATQIPFANARPAQIVTSKAVFQVNNLQTGQESAAVMQSGSQQFYYLVQNALAPDDFHLSPHFSKSNSALSGTSSQLAFDQIRLSDNQCFVTNMFCQWGTRMTVRVRLDRLNEVVVVGGTQSRGFIAAPNQQLSDNVPLPKIFLEMVPANLKPDQYSPIFERAAVLSHP